MVRAAESRKNRSPGAMKEFTARYTSKSNNNISPSSEKRDQEETKQIYVPPFPQFIMNELKGEFRNLLLGWRRTINKLNKNISSPDEILEKQSGGKDKTNRT